MAGCVWPKGIDGFIPKEEACEYEEKCSKAGVRCQRDTSIKYHCGYCKSFRMIDILNKEKEKSSSEENKSEE